MRGQNKKLMVTTIIGITTLVLLVAGATFAYFSVPIQNNYSETKASSKIDDVGTVSLLPETSELTLNLTIDDMLYNGKDTTYYATKDGATTFLSSEVIAKASVTGNGVFTCTYDLTMDATGENNMYDAIQTASNKYNQVILWVDGVEYDFGTENLFPKTLSGSITGLTEGMSHDIVAQLMLVNRASLVQNELKGTDIEITFNITNFDCNITQMGDSAKYILATSPENISTEEIDGLYRYQGTQEEVTNNYICWGTSDKEACLAEDSNYLYRIIGITPNGEIKIIQNKAKQSYWQNTISVNSNVFPYSYLGQKMINEFGTWYDGLKKHKWKYGKVTLEQLNSLNSVKEILELEKTVNNTYLDEGGLMTFSDFYNHDTCYNGSDLNYISTCTDGWLLLNKLEGFDDTTREWTSSRIDTGIDSAVTIAGNGTVSPAGINNLLYYRQVAYIASDFYLAITGTGTITDPYIFS